MNRRLLAVLIALALSFSLIPVTAFSSTEIPFDVITYPYEYGQDFTGVLLHMGVMLSEDDIDADTFTVYARTTDAEDEPLYDDYRTITDAYVSDYDGNRVSEGEYVMIELLHGAEQAGDIPDNARITDIEGCRTTTSAPNSAFVTIEYEITQNKDIPGIGEAAYMQNPEWRDRIYDQFELNVFNGETCDMNYAFYTPENTNKKSPLIIWLHGMGEGGDPYDNGVQLIANRATSFIGDEYKSIVGDSYVLMPQCPEAWPDNGYNAMSSYITDVEALIDAMIDENPNIDTNRIYLGGLSTGGFMALQMAISGPERYAAVIVASPLYKLSAVHYEALKDVQLCVVHSMNDKTVDYDTYIAPMIKGFAKVGNENVKFFEADDVYWDGLYYPGHNSWVYVYNNAAFGEDEETIFEWLADQRKDGEEEESLEFIVSTDADFVDNGDEFIVNARFSMEVNSNAAILTYKYDASKFDFVEFTAADGVSPLTVDNDAEAGILKVSLMIVGYDTTDYGDALFAVKDDAEIKFGKSKISVNAEYVFKNDEGRKIVRKAAGSVEFMVGSPDDAKFTLIDLSDILDMFGVQDGDELWPEARYFDFDKNGEIDITDICYVAIRIEV